MKFHCSVTGWGDEALQFLQEPDLNFIILFNENAPEELADISILHTVGNLTQVPAPDDTLIIGDKIFTITAVGEEAKETTCTTGLHYGGRR